MNIKQRSFGLLAIAVLLVGGIGMGVVVATHPEEPGESSNNTSPQPDQPNDDVVVRPVDPVENQEEALLITAVEPQPIPEFAWKGIAWLAEAQHSSGGWGAGSHSNQQNIDPHNVQLDPATTAFAASAFLRAGSSPTDGRYKDIVHKATIYLVEIVEEHEKEGPLITDMTGTQIQTKLGQWIDTVMTSQYLARVLPLLPEDNPLHSRVERALKVCITKIEESQDENGGWNTDGGWATVLQSSLASNTLELAQGAGQTVSGPALDAARQYQKDNFDTDTGNIDASEGAGVGLYAFAGAYRANAGEARAARALVDQAIEDGELPEDAEVTSDNLTALGVQGQDADRLAEADRATRAQNDNLDDETLLQGFGNNGGEEFLSFLLASEALVIHGGEPWEKWNSKMHERLGDIQNADGSWNGHHCITSPVFCTAAVVQCVTCDRDAESLCEIARQTIEALQQEDDQEEASP